MEAQTQQSDHDLLVTLVAKVDAFIAGQVASQNDHESRIRVLEQTSMAQQGSFQAKKDMSATAKWIIGTLIGLLAVAIAGLGLALSR